MRSSSGSPMSLEIPGNEDLEAKKKGEHLQWNSEHEKEIAEVFLA